MSSQQTIGPIKEYVVRVPKNSRKKYHMMRFHTANQVDFKQWSSAKMERENNYKEFKSLDEDQPKFGAGSEFGREQRDEARRKRYGINIRKYKADNQPWLLNVKEKQPSPEQTKTGASSSSTINKKFKGIREGGVSDNVSWYVFLQAKDGAFEAYPVEEWYNFQPINRYKALNAEEAEIEFEKRDKIMNYFSVMIQKKYGRSEEEEDDTEEGIKKKQAAKKSLMLSEMDDWMSDKDTDSEEEDGEKKPRKKPTKSGKKSKAKRGGKRKLKEDGDSGTDCAEESDEYDEGAEHEYESEDSSDPDQENDEKVTKELSGVEEGKALRNLLDSDSDSDDEEAAEKKKKEEERKAMEEEEAKAKKKKGESSSPDASDSDEEKKLKDAKKPAAPTESKADILKRKLADNPDGLGPNKKHKPNTPTPAVLPSDSGMFEEQIRRYLVRKPMTTTEILQKLKSKKTGHTSEQLVDIIAIMLKKVNPQKQRIKGKMYLSLKSATG